MLRFGFVTMALESNLSIRSTFLESSNASIRPPTNQEAEWDSQFANASWSAPEGAFGSSLRPEGVQRFILSSPTDDSARQRPHRPCILLVEDNAGDARLVREALLANSVECELVVAPSGEQALELIDELDRAMLTFPDLVLVDLNLPRKSGLEVVKRIRASKKYSATPVAILTSSDLRRDRDSVAALNVAQYIIKPSRFGEFMNLGRIFKELLNPA